MSCVETCPDDLGDVPAHIVLLAIRTTDTNGILERVRAVLPADTDVRVERAPVVSHAPRKPALPLTTRQTDILALLIRNLSNKEIGRILAISHFTVRNHVSQLLRLLNVPSRKAAIAALSATAGADLPSATFIACPASQHPPLVRTLPDSIP